MNNFELLNFAIKSNHDCMFGSDIELQKICISDERLKSFVVGLLDLGFLDKKYMVATGKLMESRGLISEKWCNTYDRREIAHYDFQLSIIDFMRGNRMKVIDVIFYISNIYASNEIGCIAKPTIEIKNKFHELSYKFRKQLVIFI